MTTFAALATAFTSALAADFGDQLDSVFDYFWAIDDVTEGSCANIGIVTKGVPAQELKDYKDDCECIYKNLFVENSIQYFLRKLFSRRKTNLHENIFIKSPGVDE